MRCHTAYLLRTWHPSTRPAALDLAPETSPVWQGLHIICFLANGDNATVEFIATYCAGNEIQRLHEVSRFIREESCWYYVDGALPSDE